MDEFREQALRFGTEIINVWIDQVDLSQRPFTLYGKESEDSDEITTVIKADTLIISTGASAKWLGIPGEAPVPEGLGRQRRFGVCDVRRILLPRQADRRRRRRRHRDGRSAVPDASLRRKLRLIHRRDEFRASKIMQDRVLAHEKIEVLWNTEVKEILGTKETGVESVTIFNNETNEEERSSRRRAFSSRSGTSRTPICSRAARYGRSRLSENRRQDDEDQYPGRLRLRRRAGLVLPPGRDRRRNRAAWRRSTPRDSWPSITSKPKRIPRRTGKCEAAERTASQPREPVLFISVV